MALFACKVGGAEGSSITGMEVMHPTPATFNSPLVYANTSGKTQTVYAFGFQENEYSDNTAHLGYSTNGNVISGYYMTGRMYSDGGDLTGVQSKNQALGQNDRYSFYITVELQNGQNLTLTHDGSSIGQGIIVH